MTKELRRLSLVMLAMFLALFVSTSVIQVVQADALGENPANKRTLYDSYEVQRGSILVGGSPIAASVPSSDVYSWQRQYADADMWAPVTGYINPVLNSARALEQKMNRDLSGTGGSQFLTRLDRLVTGQTPRGSDITLSLDAEAQRAAFDALQGYQGAVLAMEPATGRILAMATSPSYDTNLLASHDPVAVNATYDELTAAATKPMDNRAIGGRLNPPGSTFKLVVVSAALASGRYTPESTIPNPPTYQLPQSTAVIRNAGGGACPPGGDTVTIADALRFSCNIPMAQLALDLGTDAIREEAEKYGFNRSFAMPLDSTPSVYPRGLDAPQTALSGFGQSDVRATPLQMAMVSAGIAHGGVVMDPRMVDLVTAPDLSVQSRGENAEFGRALSEEDAAVMVRMMVANVENGVASGARIDGVAVAGKTGTAENGSDPYTLWFTGFAPADDPRVAVAVVIEDGGGQGQSGRSNVIAAPIAKKVMEAVLGR